MPKAKKEDLTKKVMEQIDKGQVKMRPHLYFVVGSLLLGAGLAGAVALSILFINFAFFRLRAHTPFGYLQFGQFGLRPFLATFPWLPLLVAIGGFAGAVILLQHYEISYKKGFIGLVVGVLALVLTTGLFLSLADFNQQAREVKVLRPFYQGPFYQEPFFQRPFPEEPFVSRDWVAGKITEVKDKKLVISTFSGKEVTIVWDETTRLPLGSDFAVEERVLAVGEWQDENTFVAKGIDRGGFRRLLMMDEEIGRGWGGGRLRRL